MTAKRPREFRVNGRDGYAECAEVSGRRFVYANLFSLDFSREDSDSRLYGKDAARFAAWMAKAAAWCNEKPKTRSKR
jgi:hypothetical protein